MATSWISRASCYPVATIPYLKKPDIYSNVTYGTYSDPIPKNGIISGTNTYPFGIIAYDKLTILPGSQIELGECGIELVNHVEFSAIGTQDQPIKIFSDDESPNPLIRIFSQSTNASKYVFDYVDCTTSTRPSTLFFELGNNIQNTTIVSISNSNFYASDNIISKHIHLNTTSQVDVTIQQTNFSGNAGLFLNYTGPLLFDDSTMKMYYKDIRTIAPALVYEGTNLQVTSSFFVTNRVAIESKVKSPGATLIKDCTFRPVVLISGPPMDYRTMVTLEGNETFVRDNVFIHNAVESVLLLKGVGNYASIDGNELDTNSAYKAIITIEECSGYILGTYNNLRDNYATPVIVNFTVPENFTSEGLVWYQNYMINTDSIEIKANVFCDIRRNLWNSTAIDDIVGRFNITHYEMNPYLIADGHGGDLEVDCVQVYGRKVDSNCNYGMCFGIKGYLDSACDGHGICNLNGTCTCDYGYYGERCDQYMCFNVSHNSPNVCTNGICNAPNNCTCKPLQSGLNCEFYSCDGISAQNKSVCSGNGKCIASNVCECTPPYYGVNCDLWSCSNITRVRTDSCALGCSFKGDNGCLGRGICVSPEKCQCAGGYTGQNCQDWNCFGVMKDSPFACTGNGKCKSPDTCVCNGANYTGQACEIPVCCKLFYNVFTTS